jgi:hypothetical protein
MKNQSITSADLMNQNFKKGIILLFFVLAAGICTGQTKKTGLTLTASTSLSGNGFGAIYNPGISLISGNSRFGIAAAIQSHTMNFSGAQMNYEYELTEGCDEDQRIHLFVFANATYFSNASLSKRWIAMERKVAPENTLALESLKFNSVEGYAGFGAKCRLSNHLDLFGSVGAGGWYTISGNRQLFREYCSPSIQLKAGISWSFN